MLEARAGHGLFAGIPSARPFLVQVFTAAVAGGSTPAAIATTLRQPVPAIVRTLGQWAKMGMVRLG